MDSTTVASRDASDDKRYEYFAFISYKHEDMRGQVASAANRDLSPSRIIRKQAPHLAEANSPGLSRPDRHQHRAALQNLRQEFEIPVT